MPASARQIEANRRNAAGPHQMTEAGKQAIRANAVRHGLTSHLHVVLEGEDQQFFDELRDSLLADYAPACTQETLLVHQIAEHYWRLLRARNMETASLSGSVLAFLVKFDIPVDQPAPDPSHLALAYSQHDKLFNRLGRYETTIERSYYRAIRELQKLQSSRIRSLSQSAVEAPEPEPETRQEDPQSPSAPPEPIRSVSHPREITARSLGEAWNLAEITMSEEGLEQLIDEWTAPPDISKASPDNS